MSQSENKPKLSDVARQTNADKAKRFGSTMIPAPPLPKETPTKPVEKTPDEEPPVLSTIEPASAEGPAPAAPATSQKSEPAAESAPAPAKTSRPRRGGQLSIDDIISQGPPKGESYPNQIRIAAKHHKLLRKLAFTHDVTINHIVYNLLEQLDQADQREQQKDV